MKRKWMYMYLGAAAAMLGMTTPVMAAETEEMVSEAESDATVLTETDVTLEADGAEIVIINETDRMIESGKVIEEEVEEDSCTVVFTAEDGEHTFENVKPGEWKDPRLTDDQGFLYVQYTDAEGNSREAAETAEPATPEGEFSVWALTDVNMREEASSASEIVAVVGLGDECKVLAFLPGWYQVEYKGEEGYINHRFLSDDQADAEAAAKQEQAAADAAAAAAAAQQSTYSYSYSKSGSGKKSNKNSNKNSNSGKTQEECLTNGLLN